MPESVITLKQVHNLLCNVYVKKIMFMMEKIRARADYIILHFWHCANICKTSETTTNYYYDAMEVMRV